MELIIKDKYDYNIINPDANPDDVRLMLYKLFKKQYPKYKGNVYINNIVCKSDCAIIYDREKVKPTQYRKTLLVCICYNYMPECKIFHNIQFVKIHNLINP